MELLLLLLQEDLLTKRTDRSRGDRDVCCRCGRGLGRECWGLLSWWQHGGRVLWKGTRRRDLTLSEEREH